MTTQTAPQAQIDDRSPAVEHPSELPRSQVPLGRVHRAAFAIADSLAYASMETRLVGGIAGSALKTGATVIAQSINPFWWRRQLREQRQLRKGEAVANAMATLGIPPAEYQMLLWSEGCLRQWESGRKTLQRIDGVDIGDMPREWPMVRAIEEQKGWLKDIVRFSGGDDRPPLPGNADVTDLDPVQSEADLIAADLAKQGYSVAESMPDASGDVHVLTDAPADVVEEAAVSASIVTDAIMAEDVGPAPGTEPRGPDFVGNLASAQTMGGKPTEPMQQQQERERMFPSARPKTGVAHPDNGPGAQSLCAGVDVAPVVGDLDGSRPVPESAGQAALREIGPENAVLAVGELAKRYGSPVIVADTPDGGASIAPVTAEGIEATARAMASDAGVLSGLTVDNTRQLPQNAASVSTTAVTLAAGAFTLKPNAETAAAWRRIAKQAKQAGLISDKEALDTKIATAGFIPQTGQGPLRGSGKHKHK